MNTSYHNKAICRRCFTYKTGCTSRSFFIPFVFDKIAPFTLNLYMIPLQFFLFQEKVEAKPEERAAKFS